MIEHKKTGCLAQPFDVDDLADSILWVIDDMKRWQELSRQAREKVEDNYSLTTVANQYAALYGRILT